MTGSDHSIGGVVAKLTDQFTKANLATPQLDARLLVMHATGCSHADLIASPETELSPQQLRQLDKFAHDRLRHRPVSKIIGVKSFYGHDFVVTDDVLDPRPDTETLVEAAIDRCARLEHAPRLLDIGTGSGAIVLSILAAIDGATAVATDLSATALSIASKNAKRLGIANRVEFVETNWCDGVAGPFDIIVSNPPYIPSAEISDLDREVNVFDPSLALDGGKDGVSAYQAIIPRCRNRLAPEGMLLFEIGHDQAKAVTKMLQVSQLNDHDTTIHVLQDLGGHDRVVVLDRAKNAPVEKRVGNQQQTG